MELERKFMKQGETSQGGHELVAMLYHKHAHALFKYILNMLSRREEAEDLLVEVFLAALKYQGLERLNERQQFAWLFAVARNKLADWYRANTHLPKASLEQLLPTLQGNIGHVSSPEVMVVKQEEYALLQQHIAQLPQQQREVLQLRYILGLRHAEIAELLGKTEGAVQSLLWRAIRSLRTLYEYDVSGKEDRKRTYG